MTRVVGTKTGGVHKMKKILLGLLIASLLACLAFTASIKCPMCGSNAYATGKTKADPGGVLKEYQCLRFSQHKFWVNTNEQNVRTRKRGADAASVKCPMCGANAYATGKIKTDPSGVLREYQCLSFSHHRFWQQ